MPAVRSGTSQCCSSYNSDTLKSGLYIHIPFCRSRCSYCDFATGLFNDVFADQYVAAIVREIERHDEMRRHEQDPRATAIDTIYFGGGTPSLLSPQQVKRILQSARERFDVSAATEITLEMNPGTVTLESLLAFREVGVNRASFGAQTFDDKELAKLGRSHTSQQTRQTFVDLRTAGFDNISLDLIAGLPGQSIDQWSRNVEEALALGPQHLSFYLLEVHEGTPLAAHIRNGLQPQPDEELAAEMYELMLERAERAGYVHYEISNLCLSGYESRHNTKYWTGAPYYGFGCSAHSYDGGSERWANERDMQRYVRLVEAGESTVVSRTTLTDHDRRGETLFLGLRMMSGVDLREHRDTFGPEFLNERSDDLQRFRDAGLIEWTDNRLRLTRAGALLSNEVFAVFV